MKFNSKSGFSLIEIGIAIIISGIFTVSSLTLLSASNENYRRIEQRNIALSYAMKAIEATILNNEGVDIDIGGIKEKALVENNMEIDVNVEDVISTDGNNKLQIITVDVTYHIKSNVAGDVNTLTLRTLNGNS